MEFQRIQAQMLLSEEQEEERVRLSASAQQHLSQVPGWAVGTMAGHQQKRPGDPKWFHQTWLENPLEMEVLIGTSVVNGPF